MLSLKQHSSIIHWLVLGFLFLLPWQTRYIWEMGTLAGQYWEYVSYSLYATELLLWVIILLFFVLLIRDRQNWYALVVALSTPGSKKRVFIILAITVLFGLVLARSPHQFLSYYYFFHALEAACFYYCITQLKIDGKQLFTAFWLGGAGQGVLAIVQFATQQVIANKWLGMAAHSAGRIGDFVVETGGERWLRAYGSFGSPNMLGAYLALVLVTGLLLYSVIPVKTGIQDIQRRILDSRLPAGRHGLRGNDSVWRMVLTLGQLIVLAGLVLSFSRGAWLAALVGGIILLITAFREHLALKPIVTQAVLYIFLITVLVFLCKPLFVPRLEATGRLENRSLSERAKQYIEAKRIFFSHPMLGVGPGEYTLALYQSLGSPTSLSAIQPVHNVYLLMLVEVGIPLFAVLVVIGSFIVRSIWLRNPIGLSLVSVMVVSGVFEHFWWTLYTGVVLVWVIFSLSFKRVSGNI